MLYGTLIAENIVLLSDEEHGKPIVEAVEPFVPENYMGKCSWTDVGTQITQTWEIVPIEGTAQDAALRLTMLQAQSLPDEAALEFVALYPEWIAGESYAAGQRVKYKGTLYKVLQGHVSQADWAPDAAPSLFAKVLPGQEGAEPEEGYAEWVQPDSTNGYSTGDKVVWNGHLWESIVDDNVDEPGTDNGFRWKDLGEYQEAE